MDNYQKTFETWDKVAGLYQTKFMDLDMYDDTYARFCALIAKSPATILEIGCGPGNITKRLLANRPDFQVYAIDASPRMIELAELNIPTAKFSVMDCRQIGSLTLKFDGIIAGFCMPYLSKEDNQKLIADCASLLRPGGIFYFSLIKGNYDNSGLMTASTGDQSYVYYYDELFLQTEPGKNNFEIPEIIHRRSPASVSNQTEDMIFITRKPG